MYRGTTPTLEFMLPVETSILNEAYVTLQQNGETVIEKNIGECTLDGNRLTVALSQNETLELEEGVMVEIQVRATTNSGLALASPVIQDSVERILKDGEI